MQYIVVVAYCAITKSIGVEQGHFENAYNVNINAQDEEAIRASPVGTWLIEFMKYNNHVKYEGSADEIKRALEDFADLTYNRDLSRTEGGWPKGATPFGVALTTIIPSLKNVGYTVIYVKGKRRKYAITKIAVRKGDKGQQNLVDVQPLTLNQLRARLKSFESRYQIVVKEVSE